MCKFATRDDPGYKRIEGFLRRWIDQLDDEEDMKLNQVSDCHLIPYHIWGQGTLALFLF